MYCGGNVEAIYAKASIEARERVRARLPDYQPPTFDYVTLARITRAASRLGNVAGDSVEARIKGLTRLALEVSHPERLLDEVGDLEYAAELIKNIGQRFELPISSTHLLDLRYTAAVAFLEALIPGGRRSTRVREAIRLAACPPLPSGFAHGLPPDLAADEVCDLTEFAGYYIARWWVLGEIEALHSALELGHRQHQVHHPEMHPPSPIDFRISEAWQSLQRSNIPSRGRRAPREGAV